MGDLIAGAEAPIALALLLALFAAFILERYPPDVTAAAGAAVFIVLGLVPSEAVMEVFSNAAPITIAAMFVISGALVRTGLIDAAAGAIVARARARTAPRLALGGFFAAAIVASAFVNNTPVVLILIPMVVRLAGALGVAPTRLLIPLSYAAIVGGTITLIGTSTNLLVDGVAREAGLPAFGIFEIAPVGVVTAAAGIAVMALIGPRLLPDRPGGGSAGPKAGRETAYLTEVALRDGSALIGRTPRRAAELSREGMRLLGLRRGGRLLRGDLGDVALQKGDALILMAPLSEVLTLAEMPNLTVGRRRAVQVSHQGPTARAEAVVAPGRHAAGTRLAELGLGRRFGLKVLGAARPDHVPGRDLGSVILRPADRLLLEGPAEGLDQLAQSGELVAIARPSGRAYRRRHAPIALAALVGVVGLAALGVAEIGILALIAVAAILVLRCIDSDEAWASIDAQILILIFSMLIVGAGLQETGAVQLIVDTLAPALAGLPPIVLLAAIYLTASVLTELVTNNAVAVILTPLVIGLAASTGIDPRALVVAVMFGASASFATPIGYQTNTLVYGAGNYTFADFLRIGVPMNLLVGAASVLAIATFFPLAG